MMDLSAYRTCMLCPRHCGPDRVAGRTGFCGETAVCRVASMVAHHGEEPCFSGTRGSGTVFFTGCSCGCFFCQNHQISQEQMGRHVSLDELLDGIRGLLAKGVHNVNFVTPDHFRPHVVAACRALRAEGVEVPFLYNCSGYMEAGSVDELTGVIDVFLPDFKFSDSALAQYCIGDPRYPELAIEAIARMVENVGFLTPWDDEGGALAERGVLVRHLVLPGHVENSLGVIEALHARFGCDLPLSVMSQYRPTASCLSRGEFARTVRSDEYERVCDRVLDLGFEHVFIQPEFGDEEFLPDFGKDQPFAGNPSS